jgi:phosphonate degradation associated HDIG domain protein
MPQTASSAAEGVVDHVRELFARRGAVNYGREAVTQLEHGLQAAWLAEQSGASPALIAAALLHDVGHLLHELSADAPAAGIDDVHEALGERWLRRHFGPEVCEPVRQHVAAKRYLCAVDPDYAAQLSAPSRHSLMLQGGPLTPAEARQFEALERFSDCVALRRWDDQAKTVGLATPGLEHFLAAVRQAADGGPAERGS